MNTERYHDVLLRAVPRPCRRALDVGCGLGGFARRLAEVADHVDGIDRVDEVIERARAASTHVPNLRLIAGDVMTHALEGRYDFVCALASLHHLPLEAGLARLAGLVRPGGVLGVIGLYRAATALDYLWFAAAAPFARRGRGPGHGVTVRDPDSTLREIRAAAAAHLPGAVIRRRWRFRYTLVWPA